MSAPRDFTELFATSASWLMGESFHGRFAPPDGRLFAAPTSTTV